jgi:hypothetical protein
MDARTLKQASTFVLVGAALAFLVVLSLHWHHVTVDVAGVTHVEADQMGWSGWGWLAGAAAIVLVGLNVRRARRGIEPDATFGLTDLVLGAVMLSAAVAAVFGGSADVQAGPVGVENSTILWPAWLGLVLAVVTAVSAALVALPEAWQPGEPLRTTPA